MYYLIDKEIVREPVTSTSIPLSNPVVFISSITTPLSNHIVFISLNQHYGICSFILLIPVVNSIVFQTLFPTTNHIIIPSAPGVIC